MFLSVELSTQSHNYRDGTIDGTIDSGTCYWTLTFVPSGLTSIAGILSATSLVLHGHFVTLVTEALYNLDRRVILNSMSHLEFETCLAPAQS